MLKSFANSFLHTFKDESVSEKFRVFFYDINDNAAKKKELYQFLIYDAWWHINQSKESS